MRKLLLCIVLPLGVPATAGASGVLVSDEWKSTKWAYVDFTAKVRSQPFGAGKVITKLHFNNPDGLPEIYVVLRSSTSPRGVEWIQIRLPMRPNNRTGWVPRDALGEYHTVNTKLLVNRKTFKATLFKKGRKVWSSRIGVGKSGTPTPAGKFYVRDKLKGFNNPIYGPVAFGTSAYAPTLSDWPGGGMIGIHGTNQPGILPGRVSHGCIRVPNSNILKLSRLMPIGTPIEIL